MKKLKAKAVLFDIDDTLFASSEFAEKARKNAVAAMVEEGLAGDPGKIYLELEKIIRKHGSNHPGHFDLLLKKLKAGGNRARLIAAAVAAYHDTKTTIAPFSDVPKTLVMLRDKGFRLYAVSEGRAVKQWDKLIRLGLEFFFHGVFVSEELRCEKSISFYKKIVKSLGLEPNEIVMVGDRLDKDIAPAKKAGMKTVRVLQGKYSKQKGGPAPDYTVKKVGEILLFLERQ